MEVIDGIQKNVPVLAEHHHLLVRLEDVGVAEDRRVVGEDAALLFMIGTRSTPHGSHKDELSFHLTEGS